jgi:hypothetical protein
MAVDGGVADDDAGMVPAFPGIAELLGKAGAIDGATGKLSMTPPVAAA